MPATPGARLVHRGEYATVRYVGPLAHAPGLWIGVEWDRPGVGKHDGVAPDGTRYFTTYVARLTHSNERCAGFLRADARIEWGQRFVTALHEKYQGSTRAVVSLTGAPPPPAVPDASSTYVAHADPPEAIRDACRGITMLDLSYSLLASWDVLAPIVEAIPSLRSLALTYLALNDAGVAWPTVCALSAAIPRLETLELADNALETLGSTPPGAFPKLHTLHLGNNRLAMDDVLAALHTLPALERLVLRNNSIQQIGPTHRFPRLHTLVLQGNPVRDWASLEALEEIMAGPYALHLDIPPTLASDERAFRFEAIARLGRLASLHHTPISTQERTDAERYFLTHAPPEVRPTARFRTLCEKHGTPTVPSAPRTLRAKLVHVGMARLTHPPTAADGPSLLDAPPAHAPLLRTLPIRLVRRRMMAVCGSASPDTPLYAILRTDDGALVVPLEHAESTLEFYGVQEGDTLVLASLDR